MGIACQQLTERKHDEHCNFQATAPDTAAFAGRVRWRLYVYHDHWNYDYHRNSHDDDDDDDDDRYAINHRQVDCGNPSQCNADHRRHTTDGGDCHLW